MAAYRGRPPPLSRRATAIAAVAAAATSADSTSSPHRRRSAESATAILAVSASSGLENCHASGIALATMAGWKLWNTAVTTPAVTAPMGADREAK